MRTLRVFMLPPTLHLTDLNLDILACRLPATCKKLKACNSKNKLSVQLFHCEKSFFFYYLTLFYFYVLNLPRFGIRRTSQRINDPQQQISRLVLALLLQTASLSADVAYTKKIMLPVLSFSPTRIA